MDSYSNYMVVYYVSEDTQNNRDTAVYYINNYNNLLSTRFKKSKKYTNLQVKKTLRNITCTADI